jgi:hypothetical protein
MKLPRLILLAAVVIAPACHKTEDSPVVLANQILDITDSHAQMQQAFDSGLKPSLDRLKAQGIPSDITDKIHADALTFFDDNFKWDEVKPQIADLYVKTYTVQELRDIIAFYETPTGKKVVEKMPTLLQQAMVVSMGRVQKSMPEFQRKVQSMIIDYRRKQIAAHPPAPTPVGGPRPAPRTLPPGLLLPPRGSPLPAPSQATTAVPAAPQQAPVPVPAFPSTK